MSMIQRVQGLDVVKEPSGLGGLGPCGFEELCNVGALSSGQPHSAFSLNSLPSQAETQKTMAVPGSRALPLGLGFRV